jgi:hypothetical protein
MLALVFRHSSTANTINTKRSVMDRDAVGLERRRPDKNNTGGNGKFRIGTSQSLSGLYGDFGRSPSSAE